MQISSETLTLASLHHSYSTAGNCVHDGGEYQRPLRALFKQGHRGEGFSSPKQVFLLPSGHSRLVALYPRSGGLGRGCDFTILCL